MSLRSPNFSLFADIHIQSVKRDEKLVDIGSLWGSSLILGILSHTHKYVGNAYTTHILHVLINNRKQKGRRIYKFIQFIKVRMFVTRRTNCFNKFSCQLYEDTALVNLFIRFVIKIAQYKYVQLYLIIATPSN